GFMGCHGAINGMRAALGLTAADPNANVLLVATELCSLHFCFSWHPERLLGNALFADGSAAMVCRAASPTNEADAWQVAATGSCLIPDSREAITWRIGDFGFEMSLSSEVPDLIETHLHPWLASWLDKHQLSIEEIKSWAVHPGGPRIVDAVEQSLGLQPEATHRSRDVLRTHGNMSSPTLLFILERLRLAEAPRPCVALGFGPGLVAEAALIR
ncbi:MAG: 3-oxoacyl-[acyl-carrier-protein] synthase III C-terminal domain-containing protein, partial [Planctomycetota bacterium]